MLASAVSRRPGPSRASDAIDRVDLHPLARTLLFADVMVIFFELIFAWAVPAMNAIDDGVGWAARACRRRSDRACWRTSWPTV